MRSSLFSITCFAAAFVACTSSRTDVVDTSKTVTAQPPAEAPAATLSLASIAGRWNMNSLPETGDTTMTHFVLNATADSTGWTIIYPPNRDPLPVRIIAVAGDSIVFETGPYLSARRPGMKAITRDTYRMSGDSLVGYGVGRFLTTAPDSLIRLRLWGTRAR